MSAPLLFVLGYLCVAAWFHLGRWRAYIHAEEIARKVADAARVGDGENVYEIALHETATEIARRIAQSWWLRRFLLP